MQVQKEITIMSIIKVPLLEEQLSENFCLDPKAKEKYRRGQTPILAWLPKFRETAIKALKAVRGRVRRSSETWLIASVLYPQGIFH